MIFEWDESKRHLNLRKHGLDFRDAHHVICGPNLSEEDSRFSFGERRFRTIGLLAGQVVVVIHTDVSESIRIISFRKATIQESEKFGAEILY